MKTLYRVLLFLALFVGTGCDVSDGLDADAASGAPMENLTIVLQGGGEQLFRIELADNDKARARGLMFRREMAPDAGMLFDFDAQRPVSMWMKNTYIPLDMLFIRSDGVIVTIAEDTEPQSLKSIPSGAPVLAVLELNGGTAARLGIEVGDRVDHPLFNAQE